MKKILNFVLLLFSVIGSVSISVQLARQFLTLVNIAVTVNCHKFWNIGHLFTKNTVNAEVVFFDNNVPRKKKSSTKCFPESVCLELDQ